METETAQDVLATQFIGAAIEVHRRLGPGFLESVYEEAVFLECRLRGIPVRRQVSVSICYKGESVGTGRMDLLVGEKLVVELKTVENMLPIHQAQLLSYLKATGLELGLLINFNVRLLRNGIKRIILTH